MARSEPCRDLQVGRRPDTLLLVRPSSEPRGRSLSHDGETEVSQGQDTTMGDAAQAPCHSIPVVASGEKADTDGDGEAEEEKVEEEVDEARVAI